MKRLLTIIIITIVTTSAVFAKSGLEIGIFVPLGMSVGINTFSFTNDKSDQNYERDYTSFTNKLKQNKKSSSAGFDTGVLFNIGYRFDINKDISFSLLGELGYSHDVFAFYKSNSDKESKKVNNFIYNFESLVFGIYPKLNWKKISFGLAFGIKVPLYLTSVSSYINYADNTIRQSVEGVNVFQMKNIFNVPIIPYLKFSVDYSVYSAKTFDLVLGGYIGGDFGMSLKNPQFNDAYLNTLIKQNISSFDIGFQLGMKIMPMN